MQTAKEGDTVSVHYTGKFENGEVFDSSIPRNEPLEFQIGAGMVIKGFEEMVTGMKVGDKSEQVIPCAQAYGEASEEYRIALEKSQFPDQLLATVEIGAKLNLTTQDGRQVPCEIIEITDSHVRVDANHPMAGKDLHFEIELVGIK